MGFGAIYFIRPGKLVKYPAFTESFWDESLNIDWFAALQDARQVIEAWRRTSTGVAAQRAERADTTEGLQADLTT